MVLTDRWKLGTPVRWSIALIVATIVMGASVVAKLSSPRPTLDVISVIWGLERHAAIFFAFLIGVESFVTIALLLLRNHFSLMAATVFIVMVSASIVRQLILRSELPCGCGLPVSVWGTVGDHWLGMARNSALIFVFVSHLVRSPMEKKHVLLESTYVAPLSTIDLREQV